MKYLVLLLLVACTKDKPRFWEGGFVYNDKVEVIATFYSGQQGRIVAQTWVYDQGCECNVAGYKVELCDGTIVDIGRSQLTKKDKVCK
jgi:hypothetical protein